VARQIGVGLNRGAELANVSIIGGEVAVVPELIREIDLAGTCFGAVLKTKIIDGRAIRPGDVIVGLPSTGIHSNGLTLARRVLADSALTIFDSLPEGGRPWGMGFAIVAPEDAAKQIIRSLRPEVNARVVGSVERGRGVTVPPLGLSWTTY